MWSVLQPDPDAPLVRKARSGDRRAFDSLVAAHAEMLRGFVALRVPPSVADDVLQEVWTACWSALPAFRHRSRFKAWLYGIAANKCRDWRRAAAARPEQGLDELEDIPDPEDSIHRLEVRESVRAALHCLPHAQREVVELYYYAALTLPEIAAALKRNLNTVKYQFYRAHDQVARILAEEHVHPS